MVDFARFLRGVPGRDVRLNSAPQAAWADPKLIASHLFWGYTAGRIFLGALGDKPFGISDNRHMITIAGSRAGKGTSVIVPNLLLYPGSALVIDPKGENARITARRRSKGIPGKAEGLNQDVYVLDPFGVSGMKTASFNPLSIIDAESKTAVDDAALIADALVVQEPGEGRHFTAAARNFLRSLILFVAINPDFSKRTLVHLRRYLTGSRGFYDNLIAAMQSTVACNEVIRRGANALASKPDNERWSVVSTAIEQTDFLDSPSMMNCLERSDFQLADLKRRPCTVYLCLPAGRMASHNRWLRIMVNLALEAAERERTQPAFPVLFLMDEFAVLERMESIEKAAGQIAGFGVKLWPIL